jgi:hypothetical protein
VLTVPLPSQGQPLPDQYLVNALALYCVKIVDQPAVLVCLPSAKLYPYRLARQFPQSLYRLAETRLAPLRRVYPKEPHPLLLDALEGIAVDYPNYWNIKAVGVAEDGATVGRI